MAKEFMMYIKINCLTTGKQQLIYVNLCSRHPDSCRKNECTEHCKTRPFICKKSVHLVSLMFERKSTLLISEYNIFSRFTASTDYIISFEEVRLCTDIGASQGTAKFC